MPDPETGTPPRPAAASPLRRFMGAARPVLLVLLILGALEGLLGLASPRSGPHDGLYDRDPQLFWRMRPNLHDLVQESREAGGRNLTTTISTSSLGLRDAELPAVRVPGEIRVLVMGDSSIFGHGVALADTFAKTLERGLQAARPDRVVRVVNGGVSGYSSLQGRIWFHRLVGRVQPDVVVLGFYFSDFVPDVMPDRRRVPPGFFSSSLLRLLARSNLYQFLRDEVAAGAARRADASHGTTLVPRVSAAEYQANMAAMLDEATAAGAHGMLLLLVGRATPVPAVQRPYREAMRTLAAARGIPLVDMEAPFAAVADRPPLFVDAIHPSAAGHRRVARALQDALLGGALK